MIVSGENMAPTENREREMEESNKMQLVEAEQNIPDIFLIISLIWPLHETITIIWTDTADGRNELIDAII